MKICWDNLEGMCLTRNGVLKRGKTYFTEMDSCKRCGDPYLTSTSRKSEYCGISCLKKDVVVSDETKAKIRKAMTGVLHPWYGRKHTEESKRKMSESSTGKKHTEEVKKKMSAGRQGPDNAFYGRHHTDLTKQKLSEHNKGLFVGCKNPAFKGGVKSKGLAFYDTYASQLDWCEEVRPVEVDGVKTIQVRCTNSKCREWFVPTFVQVSCRLSVLKGRTDGNNRFYCCDECKDTCSIFNKPITDNEIHFSGYQLSVWSQEVLKRANHVCEFCGGVAVHSHHIMPKRVEPEMALDPDNGIACCVECHYKYGHNGECSTGNLANTFC